jgi:hypothetical protein
MAVNIRRLKLVTGVDISTRPVRIFGKDGKAVNKSSRIPAAEAKRRAFCLSIAGQNGYLEGRRIVALRLRPNAEDPHGERSQITSHVYITHPLNSTISDNPPSYKIITHCFFYFSIILPELRDSCEAYSTLRLCLSL